MNQDEIKKQLAKDKLRDYLSLKGVNISKNFHCLNPEHEDSDPSMSYDSNRNKVHCFGCNVDWDIFDLIGAEYSLEGKEMFDKTYEILGIQGNSWEQNKPHETPLREKTKTVIETPQDYSTFFLEASKNITNTNYLTNRGISEETLRRFNVGYVKNWTHPNNPNATPTERIIFPISSKTYSTRSIAETGNRYMKVGKSELFNGSYLKGTDPVIVVEGEIDALSIEEVGGKGLSLGGVANYKKLIEAIKDTSNYQVPMLYLLLDNDNAGRDATGKLLEELKDLNIPVKDISLEVLPTENNDNDENNSDNEETLGLPKDVNEKLKLSKSELIKDIEYYNSEYMNQAKKEYIDKHSNLTEVDSLLYDVEHGLREKPTSTGFEVLDSVLGGGLYTGLYFMGAESGIGKTSFLLQLSDNIAKQGKDVLYFTLEMGKRELIAKSLSRVAYESIKAIESNGERRKGIPTLKDVPTPRQIVSEVTYTSDNEKWMKNEVLFTAGANYKQYANRLFFHEGIGNVTVTDVRNRIEEHINFTGHKPIVCIDYLQILASEEVRDSDKTKLDKIITGLKQTSRDLGVAIFGISSFNREAYGKETGFSSFKESGNIEYGADVLIGLDFYYDEDELNESDNTKRASRMKKQQELKKQSERVIELKVLKQRLEATDTVMFKNNAVFGYFEENYTKTEWKQSKDGRYEGVPVSKPQRRK